MYIRDSGGCGFTVRFFGGKNVLVAVSPGCDQCPLSGVGRCPLFGGSKCTVAIYGEVNRGHELSPLYRGCPLFGGFVTRGFTVNALDNYYFMC